ncbi:bifunctional demethylmenaquinone methyltransferase/2-methoxy-6-polyprenyl-1,4-benzoquinol methylase UbiE [Mesosutterella sp. AGMB02718]|uniref:Ubiquinone/menaquinone biosynthesis C-methyltransferase UbiE n=1 Tax=Mesosutterella faecium TaxID=2925194 RepID=A0ABT7ILR1_9BURK|nr:bifunctional demethylmenaquinone methyltransferase/2-methoxy-6-polyprenyl-1,4-benzoquinol methylase UbiE [Mesosutterella sp. AGMB02718]MDL2058863.1 bifunctional demethylmenaquinone methyltransferase/2-methoxy-6-polyprenyl-1,4-benzoquinol methylase UbiE [Mesosutterella sp. AGMB02718]
MAANDHSQEQNQEQTDFGFAEVRESEKEGRVKEVFDSVAPKYDLMNDVLSFGMHRLWKKYAVMKAAAKPGMKVLDIASGTADLALQFAGKCTPGGEVWATDINREMLTIGAHRLAAHGSHCQVVLCDSEQLPFPDDYFDVVMVSFGLRNMTHKGRALEEMCRVTKPGGRTLVLEFSKCSRWFAPFYDFYSFKFMPWLGSKIAGDRDSYEYLVESIRRHPPQAELARMMSEAGFGRVTWKNLTFGVCALHTGEKF